MRKLVGEQAAELAALVEVHINNFKGHVLGAVVSQQSGSLEVEQPELELELHLGSRREVVVDGCDAPGKAGGLDLHPAIVFEVDTECCHRPMQTYARVAALANKLAVWHYFKRRERQVVFFQPALRQEFPHPFGVPSSKTPQPADPQLLAINPAPHSFPSH